MRSISASAFASSPFCPAPAGPAARSAAPSATDRASDPETQGSAPAPGRRAPRRRSASVRSAALPAPPAAAAELIYRSRKGPAAPRFPRAQLQADILQHRYRLFAKRKRMMKMADGYRRAARYRLGYHCIPPRCQLSSRSRSINNPLIRPEHNKAITSSAAYIFG